MGVGVQSESCGEVTKHAGHRLDVHAVLESDGCEGVAEVMESDLRDARPFEDTLQHIPDADSLDTHVRPESGIHRRTRFGR